MHEKDLELEKMAREKGEKDLEFEKMAREIQQLKANKLEPQKQESQPQEIDSEERKENDKVLLSDEDI